MIKITLEFPDADDAILALAALREKNLTGGPAVPGHAKIKVTGKSPEEVAAAPDKAPGKSVKTGKTAEPGATAALATGQNPTAAPETSAAASSGSSTAGASTVPSYAEVGAAITAAVAISKPRVIEILATFGAKSGKDLKPEQYADFIKAVGPQDEDDLS